ncbi:hypothetical protein DERP_014932 [Dermatophagoides pteronyssinus]|uniref:Uncharacterized protein n=1 Tax=Dermatophagoides pteronyssinus TaxID=6956 RepID=A0ABQ8JXQ9_DERPT|nr:hypothetical protein DERP_014932 [Dermatophagoides pteronyssinus]
MDGMDGMDGKDGITYGNISGTAGKSSGIREMSTLQMKSIDLFWLIDNIDIQELDNNIPYIKGL